MARIRKGQNIFDITVQELGQIDDIVRISSDNGLSISGKLVVNETIEISEDIKGNNDIKKKIREGNILLNNDEVIDRIASLQQSDLLIESLLPEVNLSLDIPTINNDLKIGTLSPEIVLNEIIEQTNQDLDIESVNPTVVTTIPFTISPTSMEFAGDNTACGVNILTITTDAAWTAVTGDTWVNIDKSSGTGNDTITVTVDAQTPGGVLRNSNVTVSITGDNKQCDITQQAFGDACI